MKHVFIVFLYLIPGNLIVSAQNADTLRSIDNLFSGWNNSTPGGAVAIARGNKIIYQKAYGLADLEHNVPNTIETIFECGSVSKQFTAISILLLAQEGKLSLQDDVRKYVSELPVYQAPIKIQHLLNHTSGLKDWGSIGELAGWPRTTRVYTQELALEIICRQKSLNFPPGSEYSYSNSNYSLLVSIVERVSGQTLAEFTSKRLFEPIGMNHTQWRNNFRQVIPNRSIAYSKPGANYIQNMPFENVHGHGGLLTTTSDLIKWDQILDTHKIGGDAVAGLRVQKGKLNNGEEIHYAAGLFIDQWNGFVQIQHSGATAGYRAWLAYYPQKKISVALLSNDANFNPFGVGIQIAEIFLGKSVVKAKEPVFTSVTGAELAKWQGTYKEIGGSDVFALEYNGGKILSNGHTLNTIHSDTLYLDGVKWVDSKAGSIQLQNSSGIRHYARVNSPNLTAGYLAALNGNYYSDDAEVGFTITVKGNEVWAFRRPATSFQLKPAYLDGFLTNDFELYEFQRDKGGKVKSFEVSKSRAARVPFKKQ